MADVERQPGDGYRGFFAVDLDAPLRDRLTALQSDLSSQSWAKQVRWSHPENLHLTLRFMGNRTYHDFAGWVDALEPQLAQLPAFEVQIERIDLFPNPRRPIAIAALMATCPALETLVETVETTVQRQALPQRHDYRGHITLGRCVRRFPRNTSLEDVTYSDTLHINAVTLYESDMRPEGVQYLERARMPLGTA